MEPYTTDISGAPVFIDEVDDAAEWNRIVEDAPDGAFAQLWEWGEAKSRQRPGWKPLRLAIRSDQNGRPIGAVQVLVRRMPAISWSLGHAPRGPISLGPPQDWPILFEAIRRYAESKRIGTLWFDPAVSEESPLGRFMLSSPWRHAQKAEPSVCSVVTVDGNRGVWSGIRRRYREAIRRAERSGVETVWADASSSEAVAEAAIAAFLSAYRDIALRLGFPLEPADYYRHMWRLIRHSGRGSIVYAVHEGQNVGALLHVRCRNELTWYAGGQADAGEKLGSSKLLVWRGLQRAQEEGMARYNMWGSMTPGLSHFKSGFGAHEECYIGNRAMAVQHSAHLAVNAVDLGWRVKRRIVRAARGSVVPDPAGWPSG